MDGAGQEFALDELIERIREDMDRAFAHMRRPLAVALPSEAGTTGQDDEPRLTDDREPHRDEAA